MNTTSFRKDLHFVLQKNHVTQKELERLTGVKQATISRFLKGKRDISLSLALRLWPFVYGNFPQSPAAPTSTPGAADDGRQ
ncbi:MAG TPA: helix-turn-helix domain-containing protein [Candidatus Desulfovibrio intestinigallinarum]|nr:helix-turn-helix domain-containing protein [Candidatus Desulfovibrio intestinigallinarum]